MEWKPNPHIAIILSARRIVAAYKSYFSRVGQSVSPDLGTRDNVRDAEFGPSRFSSCVWEMLSDLRNHFKCELLPAREDAKRCSANLGARVQAVHARCVERARPGKEVYCSPARRADDFLREIAHCRVCA